MSQLRLITLGRFEANTALGEALLLPTRKAEVLLAYLALTLGQSQPRDRLQNLLWSDRSEEQARNSLRQTLSALKKATQNIDPPPLIIDRSSIAVTPGTIEIDVLELEHLAGDSSADSVAAAASLYRGDFLEGIAIRDSNGEDWLAAQRDRYRRIGIDAIARLLAQQSTAGELDRAVETGERLVLLDPLNESNWRQLMWVYALRAERNRALQVYNRCVNILRHELGVEPEQETTDLQASIRAGSLDITQQHQPGEAIKPVETASGTATESFAPELPDRPSIVVLPFINMSNDPEQDYLVNGITDDLIVNLSRFHDLFVIARNSSFAYQGKTVDVQQVCRELGVRYLLEGSIQRSRDEIKINVQLIDGASASHLWAERYQRHVDDIFALQEEVVELIVGTLATGYGGRLHKAWQRRGSENLRAFDCFLRGLDFMDNFTPDDNQRSREMFEEAIRLDPDYGKAYSKLAWAYMLDAVLDWSENYEESMAKALEAASRGVELEDGEAWTHWALGAYHVYTNRHDLGIAEFERAVELNPNDASVLADAGLFFSYAGNAAEGEKLLHQAMRINPHYPDYYLFQLGQVLFDAQKYTAAIAAFVRMRHVETVLSCLYLAASHAALGETDKANETIATALQYDPDANIEKWTQPRLAPYRNREDVEHLATNLRKAGLPD